MKAFRYVNPDSIASAVRTLKTAGENGRPMGAGIDLMDEMKEYIISPDVVVNLKAVPDLNRIQSGRGGLTIGATTTLAELSSHPVVKRDYPALAQAALVVGTPQIQHTGTVGGNLCQRPRCWYYRDEEIICIKKGGDRCYAVAGDNRYHAILGGGPSYIVHPSDLAPALMAHRASAIISGPAGDRTVSLDQFFILPVDNVLKENILVPGEIVTAVHVPAPARGSRSVYIKQRGRESFDWALTSAGVMLALDGGHVSQASIVMGGVAPRPWRAMDAEKLLIGQPWSENLAARAAEAALKGAQPMKDNAYKIPLARETVRMALLAASGMERLGIEGSGGEHRG